MRNMSYRVKIVVSRLVREMDLSQSVGEGRKDAIDGCTWQTRD